MPNQRAYLNQNYNEKIETITKKNYSYSCKKNPQLFRQSIMGKLKPLKSNLFGCIGCSHSTQDPLLWHTSSLVVAPGLHTLSPGCCACASVVAIPGLA